jgi:hypothetical protein
MRILLALLLMLFSTAHAQEVLLKVTPVDGFSTSKRNVFEGDKVQFKIVESIGDFKKDTVFTGTVMEYEPNEFSAKEARVVIGNFIDGTRNIKGNLYFSGNQHSNFEEFAQSNRYELMFIRGGEVVLKPGQMISFFAEYGGKPQKLPVQIVPAQRISTTHNQIQTGDAVKFKTFEGAPVIGIVDYVNNNGWWFDSAQIDFKTFKMNGKTINSPLIINGLDVIKYKGNRPAQFFNYVGVMYRGKEIEIIPEKDNVQFTIWMQN